VSAKIKSKVSFIEQDNPIDEYGRALYAVARSIFRALIDSITTEDLTDLNCDLKDVTLRQLSKIARLDRDKGMKGDGFEWAVHEAILGKEPRVCDYISTALRKASRLVSTDNPNSLLFGYERAKYLGFLDATVSNAGSNPLILPDGSGRPYKFDKWVSKAAKGKAAEPELTDRIKKIWKTDLFITGGDDEKYFATTIKSNYAQLEGGKGLRLGIVPQSRRKGHQPGVAYSDKHGLWLITLPDPDGFTGLYRDAYIAVARAICTMGKQVKPAYYTAPSAKAQKLQDQLEKYPTAKILEIEHELDKASQQKLVKVSERLVSVNAPSWLHIKESATQLISVKPRFDPIK
jgi:hypothetical protein